MSEKKVTDIRKKSLLGKYLLVGISLCNSRDEVEVSFNRHGRIIEISEAQIVIQRPNGSKYYLPPCFDFIQPGGPGEYHLSDAGEVVVDPELTAQLSIKSTVAKHSQPDIQALMDYGYEPPSD